jgi:hypothetical protein
MMMGCAILCLAISFVLSPEPRSDATIKDAQNTFQKISSGQKEKIHGRCHSGVRGSAAMKNGSVYLPFFCEAAGMSLQVEYKINRIHSY